MDIEFKNTQKLKIKMIKIRLPLGIPKSKKLLSLKQFIIVNDKNQEGNS